MFPNPLELARKNLHHELSPVEIDRYKKFGTIRVVGSDGEIYYVANKHAMQVYGITSIVRSTGERFCLDIPWVLTDERMLLFKKLLETDARLLTERIG